MNFGIAIAAFFYLQAIPVPRAVMPWQGQVQTLKCTLTGEHAKVEDYILTISDSHAFIVGLAPDQSIEMEMASPIEVQPHVFRRQAFVRRFQFTAGNQTASVRQLYQSGNLESTFVVIGSNASDKRDLPFETSAGFCRAAEKP